MAYQALYRVWRSQRFDDVVGQKAVTQTLKNAVLQNQISHAYLFTGPRGTGKTSAAKIFAKAINCPNSHDGEPCNECEMCKAITAGAQEDVIEIDAASNNGVDEIRFITDRAKYSPTQAKYKVYIIDEVHMLSTGAFNALLKTLEEPQESLVFILATTEPHKIPATIISRTQRFDFKRIDTKDIAEHLAYICDRIDVPYEAQALTVIAQAAEGGMRDALSMLDQAISFAEGTITMKDVMAVTGSLTYEMMDRFMGDCFAQDATAALEALDEILASGKEARRLLENLLVYCRDLLLYQKAPSLLAEKSGYLTAAFKDLAGKITSAQLFNWIKLLNETQNEIRFTNSPTIYLEVATVKLAGPPPTPIAAVGSTDSAPATAADNQLVLELQHQVRQLAEELQQLKQGGTAAGTNGSGGHNSHHSNKDKAAATNSKYRLPKDKVYKVLEQATKDDVVKVRNVWGDLLMMFNALRKGLLVNTQIKAAGPRGLVLSFESEMVCQKASEDEELALMISNNLSRLIDGYAPDTVFIPESAWLELRQGFLNQSGSQNSSEHTEQSAVSQAAGFGEQTAAVPQEASVVFKAPENWADSGLMEGLTDPSAAAPEDRLVTKADELFGDLTTVIDD